MTPATVFLRACRILGAPSSYSANFRRAFDCRRGSLLLAPEGTALDARPLDGSTVCLRIGAGGQGACPAALAQFRYRIMQMAARERHCWECSRNAALCNSQGHRPWNTAEHYPFRFQAPTGRPEERPVGARQTYGSGATRCPGAMPWLLHAWAFGPRSDAATCTKLARPGAAPPWRHATSDRAIQNAHAGALESVRARIRT